MSICFLRLYEDDDGDGFAFVSIADYFGYDPDDPSDHFASFYAADEYEDEESTAYASSSDWHSETASRTSFQDWYDEHYGDGTSC